jgi:hypothetical protein
MAMTFGGRAPFSKVSAHNVVRREHSLPQAQ